MGEQRMSLEKKKESLGGVAIHSRASSHADDESMSL